jgi:hypothetical protein
MQQARSAVAISVIREDFNNRASKSGLLPYQASRTRDKNELSIDNQVITFIYHCFFVVSCWLYYCTATTSLPTTYY